MGKNKGGIVRLYFFKETAPPVKCFRHHHLVKHEKHTGCVLEPTEPGRECLSCACGEWLLTPGRANTTIAGWVWTKTGETGGLSTTHSNILSIEIMNHIVCKGHQVGLE